MASKVKIGNAQGFWGDNIDAPARLVAQQPDLDYLTLDYLAEVSMSIMAIQREKDPTLGYAVDFIDVIRSLAPFWKKGSKVKVVCNAGGLNPVGCARACQMALREAGCLGKRIAVVTGDDIIDNLKDAPERSYFNHMETGARLSSILPTIVTANAYLGSKSIATALRQGAEIVITGRVADPSLVVSCCIAHFGWNLGDYEKLAGATVAGHLIECGTQVTGGLYSDWLDIEDPADIGFPLVEMGSNGSFVVTKPPNTGGLVNRKTVVEQLIYEIGDPSRYLSPDVTVSLNALAVSEIGQNRVAVTNAIGSPPPDTLKVCATYRDGYRAEGTLTIFGKHAVKKAKRCGEIIIDRVRKAGYVLDKTLIECLGTGACAPSILSQEDLYETVLRVTVADVRKEAVLRFSKEVAPLVTSGPPGVTGYTSGRPKVRPVVGYWPCLIPNEEVFPSVTLLEVS